MEIPSNVVICFQISIFEPLETTCPHKKRTVLMLWFAFKLVSLNHWKQRDSVLSKCCWVVICFQISIFEPLETTSYKKGRYEFTLWFAFKLVSLNHWKQQLILVFLSRIVVICFQISIFEPLETTIVQKRDSLCWLWFAFKLVSLNHWKQHTRRPRRAWSSCDLLSN